MIVSRTRIWLCLVAMVLLACVTYVQPRAVESAQGLTVVVRPRISVSGTAEVDQEAYRRFNRDAVTAIEQRLRDAGLKVVTSPRAKHDLQIEVELKDYDGGSIDSNELRTVIVVKRNGQFQMQLQHDCQYIDAESFAYCAVWVLTQSRKLAALGEEVRAGQLDGRNTSVASRGESTPREERREPSNEGFVRGSPQPHALAVVVGIGRYRDVPEAVGGRKDAERFAGMARASLGISSENLVTALDDRATRGDIEKHLSWLVDNARPGGNVFFYFSGHGAPDPSSGTAYILPYDGDPKRLDETALKLSDVVATVERARAKQVLVILDSCFSGAGGRSVLPAGSRPLVRVKETPAGARVAVLSAASGAQIAGPTPGGTGGLFTEILTEALGHARADSNGDGQLSLQELFDYAKPRVRRQAKRDSRDQVPSLAVGRDAGSASDFIVGWGLGSD